MAKRDDGNRAELVRIADALERIASALEAPRRKPRSRTAIERNRAELLKGAHLSETDRWAARRALAQVGRRLR